MKHFLRFIIIAIMFCMVGCAHPINITPSLDTYTSEGITKVEKNVGYYISPYDLAKEVVTPAGGGDKVKYLPYKESEPVLKKVLSNRFANVFMISSLEDREFILSNKITYIFVPTIETNSSSRSSWIWPPSDFSISINCKGMDSSGNEIWQTTVRGESHLGLPQVYRDHALAAKIATQDVFSALFQEIVKAESLR